MQLDAKFAELERRVQELADRQRKLEDEVSRITPIWHDAPGSPGIPTRVDRIEQRSLTSREAKTLNYTAIGTWATLLAVLLTAIGMFLGIGK